MKVFLSPSSKDYIVSPINGKTQAETAESISLAIEKELGSLGIEVQRADKGASPLENAEKSNLFGADLHVGITTIISESPEAQGITVYYNSSDGKSRDYATAFAENLKDIYPSPDLVRTKGDNSLVELVGVNSPSVIIALGNLNNKDDVLWLEENTESYGKIIATSIKETEEQFAPAVPMTALGLVNTVLGYATVRKSPSATAKVIARIQNGAPVRIIGKIGNWYAIIAANIEGYVNENEITAETPEK